MALARRAVNAIAAVTSRLPARRFPLRGSDPQRGALAARRDPVSMRTFAGLDRIAVDPSVLGGKPHVRGTRISVERGLEVLAQYPDRERLREDYPSLDDEALRQVLAFAAAEISGRVLSLDRPAA